MIDRVDPWGAVFACCYDRVMARAEADALRRHRGALLARAAGRVLEIGAGTGANLPFYPADVDALTLAEPDPSMLGRLRRKLAAVPAAPVAPRATAVQAGAEDLPWAAGHFDCVVSTLVLCTTPRPREALAEIHRVLRPGGALLFLEHVRAEDPRLARWQDRLRVPWSILGRGCQCNRPTLDHLRDAGFTVGSLHRASLPRVPAIVRPLAVGWARRGHAAGPTQIHGTLHATPRGTGDGGRRLE